MVIGTNLNKTYIMTLLKDFYNVEEFATTENGYEFKIILSQNHKIYEGHFPSQPVVPGVCSVQILKECAEKVLSAPLRIKTIESCKFSAMIVPSINSKLTAKLTISEAENAYKLRASITAAETTFLSLKAVLTKEEA